MISHRSNRLKVIGNPSVEKLQNGRFRLTYSLAPLNPRNDWYNDNKDRIFSDFGTLSSAEMLVDGINPRHKESYSDMRLVSVEAGNKSATEGGEYIVQFQYETLTDTFVQIKDDTIDNDVNGLRKVTRTSIANPGTSYAKVIGTSTISHSSSGLGAKTLYLSSFSIDDTDSSRTVQEVYIESGTISEVTSPGRIDGTIEVTRVSVGVASQPSGELISFRDENTEGYTTFSRTVVQGTITGTKQTYKDIISVQTPGRVELTETAVSQSDISGTIAITNVRPIRTKKIAATVTVAITTSPTDSAQVAYDLSNVSCSVTSLNKTFSASSGASISSSTGKTTVTRTGFNRSFNVSSRIQNYPGHFFVNATADGTISYISSQTPQLDDDGKFTADAIETSTTNTSLIATGTSGEPGSSDGFFETGVVQRRSRPVLITLSGTENPTTTTYYEEITYTV